MMKVFFALLHSVEAISAVIDAPEHFWLNVDENCLAALNTICGN